MAERRGIDVLREKYGKVEVGTEYVDVLSVMRQFIGQTINIYSISEGIAKQLEKSDIPFGVILTILNNASNLMEVEFDQGTEEYKIGQVYDTSPVHFRGPNHQYKIVRLDKAREFNEQHPDWDWGHWGYE